MRRLFGSSKPKEPAPSMADATRALDGRVGVVDERIAKCDQELKQYKEQMQKARGPALASLKQRALTVLKRKKMYESQQDAMRNQQFSMEQVQFAHESMRDTITTVSAMKQANVEMKKTFGQIKITDVENMQDDLEDMMMDSNEIQELMGRSYGLPDGVDEADLEAELAGLEDDLELESSTQADIPTYLPSAPTGALEPSAPQRQAEPAGVAVDEFGLPLATPSGPMKARR
eukprot:GILK01002196.1.p1 GENE.GILK01002196.1~~GILK01002196.1.p1  ORF type:complete len:231 (-),score=46.48 GILK01002196.1:118-810(-)